MINKAKEKTENDHETSQVALMLALNFTEEDLTANREGYLTKKQRSELNKYRLLWITCFALTFAALSCGVWWAILDGVRRSDSVASRIGIVSLLWIIASGVAIFTWYKKRKFDHDLRQGEVQVAKGNVQVGVRLIRPKGTPLHYLNIEGVSWAIDDPLFSSFKNGDPYAIYYAPHSKTILSAEWLRDQQG
jgi:hypothetical protein